MERTIWCTNFNLQIGVTGQGTVLPYWEDYFVYKFWSLKRLHRKSNCTLVGKGLLGVQILTFEGCSWVMWPFTDVLLPRATCESWSMNFRSHFSGSIAIHYCKRLSNGRINLETIKTTSKQVTVICDFGHSSSSSNLDVGKTWWGVRLWNAHVTMRKPSWRRQNRSLLPVTLGTFSSSSNLDIKEIMMRSKAVPNDTTSDDIGNTGKQGFQRVYQSRKKSSVTTQEAYKMELENWKPKSVHAKKENYLKNKKLDSLMQVLSSQEHDLGKALLQNSTKPLFYSGINMENTTTLRKHIGDGHMLSANQWSKSHWHNIWCPFDVTKWRYRIHFDPTPISYWKTEEGESNHGGTLCSWGCTNKSWSAWNEKRVEWERELTIERRRCRTMVYQRACVLRPFHIDND